MSWLFDKQNGLAMVLALIAAGCKLGVPTDRNVQISRHFASDDLLDSPPETRLSQAGVGKPPLPGVAAKPVATVSEPVVESLTDRVVETPPARTVANKPTESPADTVADPLSTPEAQLMQAAGLSDEELVDLLAAFRDSPPEVQQQAIRQLIAAASMRAQASGKPLDMTEQLKQSLAQLPVLPEDIDDAETLPTRLAATGKSTGTASPTVAPTAMEDPSEESLAQASSTIVKAVAETGDEASSVAKASSIALDSSPESALLPATDQALKPAMPEKAAMFQQLVASLAVAEPGESDGDRFRRDLARRYLLVLAGDPDSAVLGMEGLSKPEQEFLRHHLLAVWKMTDPSGHPVASRRVSAALASYRTATRHLAEATDQLEVKSLAFCTEIISYGQVKRFATTRFTPGQKVILYCEIDNFVAEKIGDGYETELQGSYEIFDDQGNKVAGQVLPTDRQRCDHYLRDFFIAYQMHLPGQLAAGKYRLELTMECGKGKKYGQSSLAFEIK